MTMTGKERILHGEYVKSNRLHTICSRLHRLLQVVLDTCRIATVGSIAVTVRGALLLVVYQDL